MALQNVLNFVKSSPEYFSGGAIQVKKQTLAAKNWVLDHLDISKSTTFKPLYERYIQPLDLKDAGIFGACAIVAGIVMVTTLVIFSKLFIVMSLMGAFSILCLSGYLINRRILNKFDHEVADVYKEIFTILKGANQAKPCLDEIEKCANKLRNKKFEEKDFKAFEGYFSDYKKLFLTPNPVENFGKIKDVFSTFLEGAHQDFSGKSLKP